MVAETERLSGCDGGEKYGNGMQSEETDLHPIYQYSDIAFHLRSNSENVPLEYDVANKHKAREQVSNDTNKHEERKENEIKHARRLEN